MSRLLLLRVIFALLVVPFSVESAANASPPAPDFHELEEIAGDELKSTKTPGAAVAVVRQGKVIFAKGFGVANVETGAPVTPEMLFRLGSTTKMFTAAALLALVEEGRLQVDEPVGKHVAGLHPRIAALTPHQLLTHTAGLTDESVMSGLHDDSALREGVMRMDERWLFTEPGRIYSYSNPGYWLAGLVCEELDRQPYADVLAARIFGPVGMPRTTLRPMEAMTWPLALGHEVRGQEPRVIRPQADNAATRPAGQIYSNVLELARFTTALMNQGDLEEKQVLPKAIVTALTTPYVLRPGSDEHYGYGLVVSNYRGVKLLQHGGSRSGYGSTIRLAPDQQVAVIVLANRTGSSLPRTAAKALDLTLPVAADGAPSRRGRLAFTPGEMTRLAGTYSNLRQTIELYVREEKLFMRRSRADQATDAAGAPVRLHKLDDETLSFSGGQSSEGGNSTNKVIIVSGENGEPEYVCLSGRALRRRPNPPSP